MTPENHNHLADVHASKVDQVGNTLPPVDERLGDVPEEIPTHLNGIEMEDSQEITEEESTNQKND